MKNDPAGRFRFAANQLPAGKKFLQAGDKKVEDSDTVYLVYQGKIHDKSTAALLILGMLRFPWPILKIFILIPAPVRDFFYSWFAKRRYRFFGKTETCRIPDPKDRARFLE